MTTSGGSDNTTPNQVWSGTNKGTNIDKWRNTRGRNQKNRGDNQQSIQYRSSNFTGADKILKKNLSPTERRDKVQCTEFK